MLRMQYIHCVHSLLKCSWPWLRTNRSFLQIILFVRQQLSEGKRKHPVESPGMTNSPLSSQPPSSGFQLFIDGQELLTWQVFIEITVSLLEPMTKLPISPLLSARTKSDKPCFSENNQLMDIYWGQTKLVTLCVLAQTFQS